MNRAAIVLVLVLSGCVTQSTYDALAKDHEETKATLAQRDAEVAEVRAKLEKVSRELNDRIQKLEADLEQVNRAREALNADKTAALDEKSRLQSTLDATKSAFAELAKRKAEADQRLAEFKQLLDKFKKLIDAGKLRVKIADGRMVVELASDILFASGSSALSKDGKAAIAEVATVLAEIPDRKYQVEGHTDNVPMKGAGNWELAAARAITVVKTMITAGLPDARVSAASFGESKPAQSNDTPEGKAANRRIEIVVVPDLSSLPGFDELNKVSTTPAP